MKKVTIKKTANRKYISKSTGKRVGEFGFWKKIALEQQALLHAKNNT